MAARPRTLPAAVAPVLVGTALAGFSRVFHPLRFVAALLGAIFIQVGTNLTNDYSDARRGRRRRGPARAGAGHRRRAGAAPAGAGRHLRLLRPGRARRRLPDRRRRLAAAAGRRRLDPGRRAYTGGPRPYGYEGLGEVFVFLFFGIVAVAGSYLRPGQAPALGGVRPRGARSGLLAAAILVVNNVRDIDSDRRAGKRTLAVRLGRERTRAMFAAVVYLALPARAGHLAVRAGRAWVLLPWLTLPLAAARRADRAQPHRRPVAQRGAGPHRDAAARLLRAALGGSAAEPVKLTVAAVTRRDARPVPRRPRDRVRARAAAREPGGGRRRVGYGEAAPLPSYDGVSLADVRAALEDCRPVLAELSPTPPRSPTCSPAVPEATVLPQALAAVDLALWDLAGRRTREPVWRLLGAGGADPVAGQLDDRLRRPLRRRPRGRSGPRRRLSDRQGQGGDRRRRRPPGGGAGLRRAADDDPHRRQRRLGAGRGGRHPARCSSRWGSSCARSRSPGSRRSAPCIPHVGGPARARRVRRRARGAARSPPPT